MMLTVAEKLKQTSRAVVEAGPEQTAQHVIPLLHVLLPLSLLTSLLSSLLLQQYHYLSNYDYYYYYYHSHYHHYYHHYFHYYFYYYHLLPLILSHNSHGSSEQGLLFHLYLCSFSSV